MPGASVYLTNYRGQFLDVQGRQITVDIEDRASTQGIATYLPITLNEAAIETVNNSQDPFNPISAKSARIRFLSTALINSDTFSNGTDNRFFVEIYTSAVILFQGFLLMDEIEEAFINPAFGNEVTLTATDNIGTLKELELINPDTGLPLADDHYSPLIYLLYSLKRTGLELNINLVWNVFEQDMNAAASPLHQSFIHALTFEKEIGTKEACYTVLEKILSSAKARLFQYNGEWWVVRLHEYRRTADTLRRITYNAAGSLVSTFTDLSCAANIGVSESISLINADALKANQRPHKYDKDSYRYEYPREIVPNQNFVRGAQFGAVVEVFDEDYKPELDTDTTNELFGHSKTYNIDDWTLLRSTGSSYTTPNNQAYIKRVFDLNGVEDSREVVITSGTTSGINQYYLLSEEIPMHKHDKFNVSVDFKFNGDVTGRSGQSYVPVLQIRLTGDDNTKWLFTNQSATNAYATIKPQWVNVTNPGTFINVNYFIHHYWDVTLQDEREWMNVSAEIANMPVDGTVQLALVHANPVLNRNKSFANLQFEYMPFINGTYEKYNGHYHQVTQPETFKANSENEVFLSDSPKKLFKGALKKFSTPLGKYLLTGNWTDGHDAGASGTGRIGKILAYDVWNQYRTPRTLLSGTVDGVGQDFVYCLLYNRFTLVDYSLTKKFICLHYDVDLKRCEAKAEFIEVYDTAGGNDYTTISEFNYEQ